MSARTLSAAEAAERLGKSERWLIQKLRKGIYPGHRIGRDWRITEDDYTAILAATARNATPAAASSMTRTTRRRSERS